MGCIFILYIWCITVYTLYTHVNVFLYLYRKPGILNFVADFRDFAE